jgi:hypothetical protein
MRIAICSATLASGWHQAALDMGVQAGCYTMLEDPLVLAAHERGRSQILVLDFGSSSEVINRTDVRMMVTAVGPEIVIVTGTDLSPSFLKPLYPGQLGAILSAEVHGASVVQRVDVQLFGRAGVPLVFPSPITGPNTEHPWQLPLEAGSAPWVRRAAEAEGDAVDDLSGFTSYVAAALVGDVPLPVRPGRPALLPTEPSEVIIDDELHKGVYRQSLMGAVDLLGLRGILALKGYAPTVSDAIASADLSQSWASLIDLPAVALCAAVLEAQIESLSTLHQPVEAGGIEASP